MFARILGPLFLLGIAALAALAGVLLAPLTYYRRTGRLKWLSALAGVPVFSPLCELFRLFGKQTQIVEPFLADAARPGGAAPCAGAG